MVTVYILINCTAGKSLSAAKKVAKIKGVKEAAAITGPYDVIVKAEAADLKGLGEFVIEQIQAVEGVERTMTCVAV